MFGTANQLLAAIALAIGTSYIINNGRIKYAYVTVIPMLFITAVTFTAGIENITNIYYPQALAAKTEVQGIVNIGLTVLIMTCAVMIFADAIPKWIKAARNKQPAGK
jgi:carbon starvation protein